MSTHLIDRANNLVNDLEIFSPDVPITLTMHFDLLLEEDDLVKKVGEDFATWLLIFNIVQDRLLYRPEDFGEARHALLLRRPPDPEYPQAAIDTKLPACLDVYQWNAAVERHRRGRRS